MVFQDPNAALNPAMTVEQAVGDALRVHGMKSATSGARGSSTRSSGSGSRRSSSSSRKYPRDLSGGQKQRVVIARAIVLGPSVLVADEPISMLDMSVRAKILQLMLDLKERARTSPTSTSPTTWRAPSSSATGSRSCTSAGSSRSATTDEIFAQPEAPLHEGAAGCHPRPRPGAVDAAGPAQGRDPRRGGAAARAARSTRGVPAAFDKCGWESRDLVATLESHWLRTGRLPSTSSAARSPTSTSCASRRATPRSRPPATGPPDSLTEMLDEVRRENPEARFWTGVDAIDKDAAGLTVRFHEGEDPQLRRVGNVQVACHLYPPEESVRAEPVDRLRSRRVRRSRQAQPAGSSRQRDRGWGAAPGGTDRLVVAPAAQHRLVGAEVAALGGPLDRLPQRQHLALGGEQVGSSGS